MARFLRKWLQRIGVFSVLFCGFPVVAVTAHISINQRLFDLGRIPLIKVNIVSDIKDTERFQFVLQQQQGQELLMVDRLSDYLWLLQGVDEVTDSGASLVIKEYRGNRWHKRFQLPLFAKSVPVADPPANKKLSLYRQVSPQPTTIASFVAAKALTKTPKKVVQIASSATKSATQAMPCQLRFNGTQTLWQLARSYAKDWHTNIYGAALAIFEANPKAFYTPRVSALRRDAKLHCPSSVTIAQYSNKQAAKRKFETLL